MLEYCTISDKPEPLVASQESLHLSFGIELELIFVFREDFLQAYLDKQSTVGTHTAIVKDIDSTERGLRQPGYEMQPYNSWGITNGGGHPATLEPLVKHPNGTEYRGYYEEPMQMVKIILEKVEGLQNICIYNAADHSKQTEYVDWTISGDRSLTGLGRKSLAGLARINSFEEAANWDSFGIELISPPYSSVSKLLEAVETILGALKGTPDDNFTITVNSHCGLHVHVGVPEGSVSVPLSTLQHLAFMTIIYEEAVSQLHEPSRQAAVWDGTEIQSNRGNFLPDGEGEVVTRTIRDPNTGLDETRKFEAIFVPLSQIRNVIFKPSGIDEGLSSLVKHMGSNKGHIVNWSYLGRCDGRPRTIEFRQHAGTVNLQDVKWWVEFVIALVRLAHRQATSTTGGSDDYNPLTWDDRIDIEDVFDNMEFPEEGREFFRRRRAAYALEAPKPMGYWREYEEFEEGYFEGFDDKDNKKQKVDEACFVD